MTARHEALVIGGGLAGAAVATHLARAGRDVALVERTAGPHDKVCGEFLSAEALLHLDRLGIRVETLGAVPIAGVTLHAGSRSAHCPLPFRAMSLSRRILDEAVLDRAAAAGARILRGEAVRGITGHPGDWQARIGEGALHARTLFLATGKHDLRGRPRPPGRQNDLVGFKLHFETPGTAPGQDVEVVLFPGGYAGIEPVEQGRCNLCLLVERRRLQAVGGNWPALADWLAHESPRLARLFGSAAPASDRPLTIANIPYGLLRRSSEGPFHLGDQAAVIPSFAGEGMSIALHSAWLAARFHLAGADADAFQRRLAADLGGQIARATAVSRLAVRPSVQPAALRLAGMIPASLGLLARLTRIPDRAMRPAEPALQA